MEYGEGMPRLFRREFGLGICSEGDSGAPGKTASGGSPRMKDLQVKSLLVTRI